MATVCTASPKKGRQMPREMAAWRHGDIAAGRYFKFHGEI
jgi:hypothetical protein